MGRLEQMAAARAFAEANPEWHWDDRLKRLSRLSPGVVAGSARVKLSGKTWIAYASDSYWSSIRAPRTGNPKRFRSIAAAVKALGFPVNPPTASVG